MMKRVLIAAALVAASASAFAGVGVSVNVGQPGFYGQINLGDAPPPQVIYQQPVMVAPAPVGVPEEAPIYLHVPPGYERHWARHCGEYGACGRRVMFVRDNWYNQVYVPHYREHGGRDGHWEDRGDHDHGGGRDHDHGDHGDHDRGDRGDHDHGHGGWDH